MRDQTRNLVTSCGYTSPGLAHLLILAVCLALTGCQSSPPRRVHARTASVTRPVRPAAAAHRPTADVPATSSDELPDSTAAEPPLTTATSVPAEQPGRASDPDEPATETEPATDAQPGADAELVRGAESAAVIEPSVTAREAYEPPAEATHDFITPELPVLPSAGTSDTDASHGTEQGTALSSRPGSSAFSPSDVLAAVSAAGGRIKTHDDGTVYSIDLSLTEAGDPQIRGISAVRSLVQLDLSQTRVQDAGLTEVSQLELLRSLKLRGTQVTDLGIRQLSGLTGLLLLDLSGTAVTDDGLVDAGQWRRLRYLSLTDTAITDRGLLHLQALKELKGLNPTSPTRFRNTVFSAV